MMGRMGSMSHTLAFLLLLSLPLGVSADTQPWITGYFMDGSMSMSDIPWNKVTHVIHFAMDPSDSAGDLEGISSDSADAFTAAAHNAGVKALFCVRDNNSNLGLFSSVLRYNLAGFVTNIVNFVNAHNYDGVDLNWEAGNFDSVIDQNNYINLVTSLRNQLGPSKTITMAVYWQGGLASIVQRAANNLDQVNVMCYDMDQYNNDTYFNSATYGTLLDVFHNNCAMQAGNFTSFVAPAKMGLGIPFYGRIWTGCTDLFCSDGLHDPLQLWWGRPTQKSIHYNALVASPYWSAPHSWDSVRQSSYISIDEPGSANDRFITFTDPQQIGAMVQLMRNSGYGGIMEYELEYDFLSSQTGDARHPLAAAVYNSVFGSPQQPQQ